MNHPYSNLVSRIPTLPESIVAQVDRRGGDRIISRVHELGPVIAAQLQRDPRAKAAMDRIGANARHMAEVGFRWRAHLAQQATVAAAPPAKAEARPKGAKARKGGKR